MEMIETQIELRNSIKEFNKRNGKLFNNAYFEKKAGLTDRLHDFLSDKRVRTPPYFKPFKKDDFERLQNAIQEIAIDFYTTFVSTKESDLLLQIAELKAQIEKQKKYIKTLQTQIHA